MQDYTHTAPYYAEIQGKTDGLYGINAPLLLMKRRLGR